MHSNQVEIPAAQFFAALDAMTPQCGAAYGGAIMAAPAQQHRPFGSLNLFSVTLNYRKGADFHMDVHADNAVQAIAEARRFAIGCGFTDAEKRKPTVYEVQA